MGGPGSGNRWRFGAKPTTDDYHAFDVRRIEQAGMLTPGRVARWRWSRNGEELAAIQGRAEYDRLILIYRHRSGDAEWKDEHYVVRIVRTPCNFGGSRAWFICPALGCGRRVAILYGGGLFACRHCYRLAYPSQREAAPDRTLRRAQRIRQRLGGTAYMMEPSPMKPKWMRWRTFERLRAEGKTAELRSLAGFADQLKLWRMK